MTSTGAKSLFTVLLLGLALMAGTPEALAYYQEGGTTAKATEKQPSKFLMRLNKGRKITAKRQITLEFKTVDIPMSEISRMRIGYRSDLSDASWITFEKSYEFTLTSSEGEKTIFVQLQDQAGNNSEVVSSSIVYDITAPTGGSLRIDEGATLTNNRAGKVNLYLKATDAFKMKISNSPYFDGVSWERYTETRNWVLPNETDGQKTVYVQFADIVDNTSPTVKASIELDRQPPTGTLTINAGDRFVTGYEVKLQIKSDDPDVTSIRIATKTDGKVLPYERARLGGKPLNLNWTLDSLNGTKAIAVFFRDKAGNISPKPAVAQIVLDTQAPERPFLSIDNSAKYTTNKAGTVDLKLGTRETPTGYQMMVSNNERFTGAETVPYQAAIAAWKLSPGDGLKNIYVKYIDQAGNESEVATDRITLDTSVPVAGKLIINNNEEWARKPTVSLSISAQGADLMQVDNNPDFSNTSRWLPYTETVDKWILQGLEGSNTVYVRFRDAAGNTSEVISDEIKLDTKPPVGRILINKGSNVLTSADRKVNIRLVYNSVADEMMISNDAEFSNAQWQPAADALEEWVLSPGDGIKTVYAKFRDAAGLLSPVATDKILLDTTPPQEPRIMVNNNAPFTVHPEGLVQVKLRSVGAKEMLVHEESAPDSVRLWEPYRPALDLHLHGADGVKKVIAIFRDEHGNETSPVSAKITLDRSGPTARLFVIDNGAEWTNRKDKKVSLKLNADDAHMMKIALNKEFAQSKWQKFTRELTDFELPGDDGQKELWVIFKDEAGNLSEPLSAAIKLKREF